MRRFMASVSALLAAFAYSAAGVDTAHENPVAGRLCLGTRMMHTILLDASQHYIGRLDELEVNQDYTPTGLFADYFFTETWGVELAWSDVDADARNSGGGNATGDADGDVSYAGPVLTVIGRFPNDYGWTPYGGAGFCYLDGEFHEATWWHQGYSSKEDWESLGKPVRARGGKQRRLNADDTFGVVLTAGADYALAEHWSAGIYGRLLFAEGDADVEERRGHEITGDESTGSFDVSNLALGLTVKYDF